MATTPVRFKRVAAVFDEEARARLCDSSGTEHSGQSLTDLSDLVNSFFEDEEGLGGRLSDQEDDAADKTESPETNCSESEIKDALKRLFNWEVGDDARVMRKIHTAVVKALQKVSDVSDIEFKRRLMVRLRRGGHDAGLCKSKWEKAGRCPSGDYEYIDVNVSGTRYFVEVFLAKEFTIARPTGCYAALLNMFPQIFIGKQEELKQVTRLMCRAIKKSMEKMDIHVPPWRRHRYVQAKWFSSYKRTINEAPIQKGLIDSEEEMRRRKRSVGFAPPASAISFLCREDSSAKAGGLRVGNLAAALNDNAILS